MKKKAVEEQETNKMAEQENTQNNQQEENIQNEENIQDASEQVNEAGETSEENTSAESEVDKLKQEVTEANNKYLRLYAEFDNYKRRTNKERIDLLQTAGKDVIVSMLVVLDDFERAAKAMESAQDVEPVKEGVALVHHKLKSLLTQKGLTEMQSIGNAFDADIHEAITNIPAPSDDLKGKVIDEVEKGYYLNDKVIRYAKVVVGV